jgi:RNA polymerase sigma-70 factor (ECF subfamily)
MTDSRISHAEELAEYLIKKYSDMVFKIAFTRTNNAHDAEDIMQEVFFRYIRSNPQFENTEHEKAWFIRVTINLTKSLLTSSWFRRTTELKDNLSVTMSEKSEVYYAVATLPKDMRTVIHLYYYEDYKVDEIAEILGKSSSYVKSILMRARKKLKAALGETFEAVENANE